MQKKDAIKDGWKCKIGNRIDCTWEMGSIPRKTYQVNIWESRFQTQERAQNWKFQNQKYINPMFTEVKEVMQSELRGKQWSINFSHSKYMSMRSKYRWWPYLHSWKSQYQQKDQLWWSAREVLRPSEVFLLWDPVPQCWLQYNQWLRQNSGLGLNFPKLPQRKIYVRKYFLNSCQQVVEVNNQC